MDSISGKSEARDSGRDHVLVVPFPVIGRTNPILQFAKRLSSKGLHVTVATTPAFASSHRLSRSFPFLSIATISDGTEESESANTVNVDQHIQRFTAMAPQALARLIKEQDESEGKPIRCIIYDSSLTWALGLARNRGIYAAPFFPQSCAVSLIFCHVSKGLLAAPLLEVDGKLVAPGLPVMEVRDLPTLVQDVGKHPILEKLALGQFDNFDQADWQFFNTFDSLEKEVINWALSRWPRIKTIGPAIPSAYLDKRLENDNEYGLSLFNSEYDTCIKWLDMQEDGCTIFISFGSLAAMGQQQMQELASGLKNSNKPFFTHCGWNSTLETICFGVPVIAMPQWADQMTNAFFMENVWKIGVRVKANCEGLVEREEIECCIKEIMEGKKGVEMRSNASKWKVHANMVMQEGGTSDKNIEDFVTIIKNSS